MQPHFRQRFSNASLLLGGIFLLGLVLRLGWIDAHGFWTDEVSSLETARNGLPFVFSNHFGWVGNQTPWHYAFIWLVLQVLPLDPAASAALVRLPSALAGAFLTPVVYGLGRELFSRTAGLIAALMVALSPILLDHSHDLRPYSFLTFLTAASVLCLVMAERTGKAGWWLGFLAVTVANLLNSYLAATLVLPALVPYLAWAIRRAWTQHLEAGRERNLLFLLLSLAGIGMVASLMLIEYLRLPGTPVDWSKFSIVSLAAMPVNVFASFTDLGITGPVATLASLALLLLAIFGAYTGIRQGHGRGIAICVPLCLAPSFVLAAVVTSNLVFPRYVLFIGPFYFLLIGNAIATALQFSLTTSESDFLRRLARPSGVTLAWLICALYLVGTFNYINPATHRNLSYRPDFRGVAQYLSEKASPQDSIILADYPAHGYSVTNFYWQHEPPAHLYDARDPRLFRQAMQGNVYWVISLLDTQLMDELAGEAEGWTEVVKLEDVVVLKEKAAGHSPAELVGGLAEKMDTLRPGFMPARLLRGEVLQARGDSVGAAEMYRDAVSGFWTGDIYLRTAQGFAGAGLSANAWQEGIISKAMEPYRPEVHRWLAQQLQREGYGDESLVEQKIADTLQSFAGVRSGLDLHMIRASER
jgi:mannosyltransferase